MSHVITEGVKVSFTEEIKVIFVSILYFRENDNVYVIIDYNLIKVCELWLEWFVVWLKSNISV